MALRLTAEAQQAHHADVTGLAWISQSQFVSVGQDNNMVLWKVAEKKGDDKKKAAKGPTDMEFELQEQQRVSGPALGFIGCECSVAGKSVFAPTIDGPLYRWSLADEVSTAEGASAILPLDGGEGWAVAAMRSPADDRSAEYLAVAGAGGTVRVIRGARTGAGEEEGKQADDDGDDDEAAAAAGSGGSGSGPLVWSELCRATVAADEHIMCLATHPTDPSLLACGTAGGDLFILNMTVDRSGLVVRGRVEAHARPCRCLQFSAGGQQLLSGGDSGDIVCVDLGQGEGAKVAFTLEGHSQWVMALDGDPSGSQIISVSLDKSVRVWDIASRQEVGTASDRPASFWSVAASPSGRWIAVGDDDGRVAVFNAAAAAGGAGAAGATAR